jgi:K+-transporting ATPase ATPase B chain
MMSYLGLSEPVKSLGTDVPTLVALLVCLIPTTIGALLAAIGIAGMDRALQANIIAKSGKAVETAGDIDTVLLDKTGTITVGNRHATDFKPVGLYSQLKLAALAALASVADETPEGKSIVIAAQAVGVGGRELSVPSDVQVIAFSAQTRMSGVDFPDGRRIRKGAPDAVIAFIRQSNGEVPGGLEQPRKARRLWWWRRILKSPASSSSKTF